MTEKILIELAVLEQLVAALEAAIQRNDYGCLMDGDELQAASTFSRRAAIATAEPPQEPVGTKLYTADQLRQAIAADRAKLGKEVQDGWKLVPVEPTKEMIKAAGPGTFWESEGKKNYIAMLAAAPQPQQQEGGEA